MTSPLEQTLTEAVLARIEATAEPRFKEIMTSLIRHLHAFVRETELTEAEWFAGIQFLTATGQKCDAKRQEYILLSDTLGVSMLVDAINHRKPGSATETTVLGPFYVPGSKHIPMWTDIAAGLPGVPAYVHGRVLDVDDKPVAGAELDVWQNDSEGFYDVQRPGASYARGKFTTDAQGRYGFRTTRPVSYPIPTDGPVGKMLLGMGRHPYRPAHVHAKVSAPGYDAIITHLFVKGDPYLGSDAVFGVKDSLVVEFNDRPGGRAPDGKACDRPFSVAEYDFRLVRAGTTA
ncbi:MAG: intradiol ring-cleavage dioxygenase [Betaproteobacteria bacterium]